MIAFDYNHCLKPLDSYLHTALCIQYAVGLLDALETHFQFGDTMGVRQNWFMTSLKGEEFRLLLDT